jgi:DNA polymerase I-like protein with 3'-5' exonuclease and polymerase domains
MILDVDLSQIEWRVCADMTKDPVMIAEIMAGQDQHAFTCTAADMMNLPLTKDNRTDAKIFNFRAIFTNPETAAYAYYMDAKMPPFTQKRWNHITEGFYDKYKGMVATHNLWIDEVRKTGQLVGPTGRIWKFVKEQKKGYYDYSVTKPRNYPVQGSSGDLIKLALIKIKQRISHIPRALLTMTVHDSIILDVEEKHIEETATICIHTFRKIPEFAKQYFDWDICVPIDGEAEFGPTWGDMREIVIP